MRLPPALLVVSAASLAFSAAAPLAHAGGPAVCNAKHTRPANLYGSVLSDGLKPALAAAAPPPSQAKPEAAPSTAAKGGWDGSATAKPKQLSRAELKASFSPCGGDRA